MSDPFGMVRVTPPTPAANLSQEIVLREKQDISEYRGNPRQFIRKRMFWCAKCNKEPGEMGCYAAEDGRQQEGYIHGYCKCHGAFTEFAAPFPQAWAAIDSGERITVFDATSIEAKNHTPQAPGDSRASLPAPGDAPSYP